MKIGILGGSFDPVHEGHLILTRESQRQFKLDKILFIPAFLSPLKTRNAPVTPAPLRARMVALAIKGEPTWELCDLEFVQPGVSYTVDTLHKLRKIYPPPDGLFFIAGADAYEDLKNWKDPDEIMKLCEWIVAPRSSAALDEKMPPRFHRLKMRPVPISATEIRKKAGEGKDVSVWVPHEVDRFIKRMKIYEAPRS